MGQHPDLTDDLIGRAVSGEASAIESVAQIIESPIRGMVAARLCGASDRLHGVEDVAQIAHAEVMRGLPRLRLVSVGGFRGFASSVVSNKVADYIRRQSRERASGGGRFRSLDSNFLVDSGAGPLWQFLSNGGVSPRTAAVAQDQLTQVLDELGELKEEHRDVITLAFFDRLTTSQIADHLGVSRPAASMLLLRAIGALRRRITGSSQLGRFDE